jgi:RNA polymerase sigma-70 factor (ECF subfamily)
MFSPARGRASTGIRAFARCGMLAAWRRVARGSVELRLEDDELEAASPVDVDADPAHRLDAARRAQAVRAALERLDAQPRQLLSLAFFRGMTHEEVAVETGLPLGTVKSSIRRALTALKEWLGPGFASDPAM